MEKPERTVWPSQYITTDYTDSMVFQSWANSPTVHRAASWVPVRQGEVEKNGAQLSRGKACELWRGGGSGLHCSGLKFATEWKKKVVMKHNLSLLQM